MDDGAGVVLDLGWWITTIGVPSLPVLRTGWGVGAVFGDVAQLVERFHGMEEVESSNLFVSTSRKRPRQTAGGVFAWVLISELLGGELGSGVRQVTQADSFSLR